MPKKKTGKKVGRPKGVKPNTRKKPAPVRGPVSTSFQKGNDYWRQRMFNPEPAYTPDELKEKWVEYVQFHKANPWKKVEVVKSGDYAGRTFEVNSWPPYTQVGFCNYANITENTFRNYDNDGRYLEVTTKIKQAIYESKFDGATQGFFNANIIARDLGLKDSSSVEVAADKKNVEDIFAAIKLNKKKNQ